MRLRLSLTFALTLVAVSTERGVQYSRGQQRLVASARASKNAATVGSRVSCSDAIRRASPTRFAALRP